MADWETAFAHHDEQIKTLFNNQKIIEKLADSVQELAESIATQTEQIKNMDKRLSSIEDNAKYKNRTVWACVVTGILGAAIAAVMTMILG